ncbi:DoxX family protein [Cohnella sp.]|uniref:DoxX family protein n=1 Tax=Cohnella sp. TaxID=1883426 RepID=UPI003561BD99
MNIVLWIVQIGLGVGFMYSGWLKVFQYESALSTWTWVNDIPQGLVMLVGIAELLGVLGLILPMALKIKPLLTPIAAVGLAAIACSGMIFHLLRGEYDIWINIVFTLSALLIAAGRFRLMRRQKSGKAV